MGILDRLVLGCLPLVPRPIMRRLSAPYIAGETLEEALARLEALASEGYAGILDILGEDVGDERAARAAAAAYATGATRIAELGLDCYVSIKPTHLGLRLSPELAFELYDGLLDHVGPLGQTLRVEMEDHTTTDATLALFARLSERHEHVGIVLQSRLFRTLEDIEALPDGNLDVRLVKGIYLEPERIAHTGKQEIRDAFVDCARHLFARGARIGIASHDESLAARVLRLAADSGVAHERYELEVLLGVQRRLWEHWKAAGHKVRVYVPYGPEWRSYSQRRLRKNPEILRHVMRSTLSFGK